MLGYRTAAWLPGDWRLAPTDVYDAENADHVAIKALVDENHRAFAAKDWDALRETMHPSYRALHGKGPDPEVAAAGNPPQTCPDDASLARPSASVAPTCPASSARSTGGRMIRRGLVGTRY